MIVFSLASLHHPIEWLAELVDQESPWDSEGISSSGFHQCEYHIIVHDTFVWRQLQDAIKQAKNGVCH